MMEIDSEVEIILPLRGISYNSACKITKGGWLYKSKHCKQFQQLVYDLVKHHKQIEGEQLEVEYTFYFRGHKKLDVANYEKLLSDALNKVLFEDDSLIFTMLLHKQMGCDSDSIKVRVKKIK